MAYSVRLFPVTKYFALDHWENISTDLLDIIYNAIEASSLQNTSCILVPTTVKFCKTVKALSYSLSVSLLTVEFNSDEYPFLSRVHFYLDITNWYRAMLSSELSDLWPLTPTKIPFSIKLNNLTLCHLILTANWS